jgi:IS30 family transposase
MAQRSIPALPKTCNRKQPTKAALLKRTRAQRIPFRPGDRYSNKGRIHSRRPTCHSHFSLAKRRRTIHSGLSIREIANRLQRAVSTVSREVSRHGGRPLDRASEADRQAWESALRPKVCLLAPHAKLRTIVASKLILDWSPEQISKWLKVHYPSNESMRVSHETIYRRLIPPGPGSAEKRAGSAPQVQAAYTSLTTLAG